MSNLKKLEKSKGVVLFAFNTKKINYVSIADSASQLIKKYLNLPVTLITGIDATPEFNYENVIRVDPNVGNVRFKKDGSTVEWKNFDRYLAYNLSPYDTTILMDVDYLLFDSNILKLLYTDFDYKIMHRMQTPDHRDESEMGPISLPLVWATLIIFNKTKTSQILFDMVGKIQRNYNYYRQLFGIRETIYRNDFAFSMANIIINGYALTPEHNIPWDLITIEENIKSIEVLDNFFVLRHLERSLVLPKQSLHIMDKNFLMSENYKNLVKAEIYG